MARSARADGSVGTPASTVSIRARKRPAVARAGPTKSATGPPARSSRAPRLAPPLGEKVPMSPTPPTTAARISAPSRTAPR